MPRAHESLRALTRLLGSVVSEKVPERSKASRVLTAVACRLQLLAYELECTRAEVGLGIEQLFHRLQQHCQLLVLAGKGGGGVQSGYALLCELSELLSELHDSIPQLSEQLSEDERYNPARDELRALTASVVQYRAECDVTIGQLETALSELVGGNPSSVATADAAAHPGAVAADSEPHAATRVGASPAAISGADGQTAAAHGDSAASSDAALHPPPATESEPAASATMAPVVAATSGPWPPSGGLGVEGPPLVRDLEVLQRVRRVICGLELDVEMEERGQDLDAELLELREHMRRAVGDDDPVPQRQQLDDDAADVPMDAAPPPEHPLEPAEQAVRVHGPEDGRPVAGTAASPDVGPAPSVSPARVRVLGRSAEAGQSAAGSSLDGGPALVVVGGPKATGSLARPGARRPREGPPGIASIEAMQDGGECDDGSRLDRVRLLARRVSRQLAAKHLAQLKQQQQEQQQQEQQQQEQEPQPLGLSGGGRGGAGEGAETETPERPAEPVVHCVGTLGGRDGQEPLAQRRRVQEPPEALSSGAALRPTLSLGVAEVRLQGAVPRPAPHNATAFGAVGGASDASSADPGTSATALQQQDQQRQQQSALEAPGPAEALVAGDVSFGTFGTRPGLAEGTDGIGAMTALPEAAASATGLAGGGLGGGKDDGAACGRDEAMADASVVAVRHLNLVTTLASMWEAGAPPQLQHPHPHPTHHPLPHPDAAAQPHALQQSPQLQHPQAARASPHAHPQPQLHVQPHGAPRRETEAGTGAQEAEEEMPWRPSAAAVGEAGGARRLNQPVGPPVPRPRTPPPLPPLPGPLPPPPGGHAPRCASPFLMMAMQARAAKPAAVAPPGVPPPLPPPPPVPGLHLHHHHVIPQEQQQHQQGLDGDTFMRVAYDMVVDVEVPEPPAAAVEPLAAALRPLRIGRSASGVCAAQAGGPAGGDSPVHSPTLAAAAAAAGAPGAQRQRFAPAPLPLPDASVHLRAVGLPEDLAVPWSHWRAQGPLGPPGYGVGPWLDLCENAAGGGGGGAAAAAAAAALTAAAAAAVNSRLPDFGPDVPTLDLRRDITSWGACLGRGAFGAVYKALFHNQPVAVKVLHGSALDVTDLHALRTEISLLCRLRHHPNIIKVYGAAAAPPDQVALVTELMDCDLYDYIHRRRQNCVPLDEVLFIARAIATGLAELHPAIVHRDLKPANVLLRSSAPHQHQQQAAEAQQLHQQQPLDRRLTVKIADFGLARHKRSQYLSTRERHAGTLKYMAPECVTGGSSSSGGGGGSSDGPGSPGGPGRSSRGGGSKVTEKCDVYSFGVLLYELITGREPWEGCNAWYAFSQVQAGVTLKLPEDPGRCPPALRQLVQRCWSLQHHQRPSSRELVECLDAIIAEQAAAPGAAPMATQLGHGPAQ